MMQRSETEVRPHEGPDADLESGSRPGIGTQDPMSQRAASRQAEEVEEISLLALGNVLLKRWRLVLGLPLLAAVVAAVISFIVPLRFTASAVFIPEQESQGLNLPAGLAGIASQFGVALPAGAANSAPVYGDIIGSRTIRDEVLQARYPDPRVGGGRQRHPLADPGSGLTVRLDTGYRRLRSPRECPRIIR